MQARTRLEASCGEVAQDDTLQRLLAVALTNCHLAESGLNTHACEPGDSVLMCTRNMKQSHDFDTYTAFFNQATAICFYLQQNDFNTRSESLVRQLLGATDAAGRVLDAIASYVTVIADLQARLVETSHAAGVGDVSSALVYSAAGALALALTSPASARRARVPLLATIIAALLLERLLLLAFAREWLSVTMLEVSVHVLRCAFTTLDVLVLCYCWLTYTEPTDELRRARKALESALAQAKLLAANHGREPAGEVAAEAKSGLVVGESEWPGDEADDADWAASVSGELTGNVSPKRYALRRTPSRLAAWRTVGALCIAAVEGASELSETLASSLKGPMCCDSSPAEDTECAAEADFEGEEGATSAPSPNNGARGDRGK